MSDIDAIRQYVKAGIGVSIFQTNALAALARIEAAAEQTEKTLANLVEHIDANGGCHRGCPEHDDARAALKLLRDKDTRDAWDNTLMDGLPDPDPKEGAA